MQPLLDGPRHGLSDVAVRGLLQSHSAIQIGYGALGLDSALSGAVDITPYMTEGSSISCNIADTVQRTINVNIDSDVSASGWSYLSGFIKPYMTFTDVLTGFEAQFNLGVYTLTTPDNDLSTNPATLNFAGYDLIQVLQNPVADSYEVAAGQDPAIAAARVIEQALPGVTVTVTPSGAALSKQMTFPFNAQQPHTYLDMVDTLLATIGYRQVWVDWEGRFRIEPYVDIQSQHTEWTFDLSEDDNIVAEKRTQTQDLYSIPNWWRFVLAGLSTTPVEGTSMLTHEDSSQRNPGSSVNRGRQVRKIVEVTGTTYAALQDYAQRTVDADLKPSEVFTVALQPFPLMWHMDVLTYIDPNLVVSMPAGLGTTRRVLCTSWTLPLDGQSDMTATWQTINDQSVLLGVTATSPTG